METPTDGNHLPLKALYRGFHIRVHLEAGVFVAQARHSLDRRSDRPRSPRICECYIEHLASSILDAATALQMAREKIERIYQLEAEAVLTQAILDCARMPRIEESAS